MNPALSRSSSRRRPAPDVAVQRSERIRGFAFLALIVLCFLTGGGARGDVLSLLILRPAAVLCATGLLVGGRGDFRAVRGPLLLIGALAAVMLLQLVPLPPALWTALPQHAVFAQAAEVAGAPQPWRPLSISPELTWNSLAALVVPAAVLVGFASVDDAARWRALPTILAMALFSAALGIGQVVQGPASPLYLYRITSDTMAVGLFANRNHAAALLVVAIPLLAAFIVDGLARRRAARPLLVSGAGLAMFLAIMIAVIGSRGGLVLMLPALAVAAVLLVRAWPERERSGPRSGPRRWLLPAAAAGALLVVGGAIAVAGGGGNTALGRLLGSHAGDELRYNVLPMLLAMAKGYLPWGSGFGTFDPAYRIVEPLEQIGPYYLNHAHNDVLELIITGGLPGLLVAVSGVCWLAIRLAALRGIARPDSRPVLLAWSGAAVLVILLAWSAFDYPLRTPSLAALAALAAAWLASAAGARAARDAGRVAGAPGG